MFGVADTTKLSWLGYVLAHLSKFKSTWAHIVDNLDPQACLRESVLQELLYEQLKQSVVLDAGIKHQLRLLGDSAYQFLLYPMVHLLDRHRVEKNRSL